MNNFQEDKISIYNNLCDNYFSIINDLIDFSSQNKIIPIEVKAGTTGSLKSLHIFMDLKELDIALRINADLPTITQINIKDHKSYKLFSIPYYLIGEIHRLLATNI